jgi:hypothetical protein
MNNLFLILALSGPGLWLVISLGISIGAIILFWNKDET